jgi:uncharacterized protein (DUF1800 family)
MSKSPWTPYRPTLSSPWSLARAWTLRRRAGFAATWNELTRDLDDGADAAVSRVLAGTCRMDGVPAEFQRTADLLGDAAAGASDAGRLQAWWLFRMLFTPDPLTERMTLFWHNHFATSQLKVDDVAAMKAQNQTFRRHARGPFGVFLHAMLRDPALLVWLDAPANRKRKPNENLARELMELFTLGVGHYTENDVKEAARSLTGRAVVQGRFSLRDDDHDDGTKTILGRSDRFDGDKLADRLLAHRATAHRLASRLCHAFLGENVADESAVIELAGRLGSDELHIGRAVEVILRSELFFSERNMRAQVADPVGFVIGTVRAVEQFDPPPSTLLLAEWTGRMGQALFYPPNVGGWQGGRSWLSGRSVVARANFATALVECRLYSGARADIPDLHNLATRHNRGQTSESALRFVSELATGRACVHSALEELTKTSDRGSGSPPGGFNRAVALMLSRPDAQLC